MTVDVEHVGTFAHATVYAGPGDVPRVSLTAMTDGVRVEMTLPLPVAMDLLVAAESAIGRQMAQEARERHARVNVPFPGLTSA